LLKTAVNSWQTQGKVKVEVVFTSSINPAYALLNKEKFTRVIDNLVSNAVKFSNERVDVRLAQADKQIVIEVQDYGLGIPAAMLPDIFTRFTKAGRAGLHGEKSTGLGLSIVRQIVESHKGTIEVESTEGKGSVFVVKLPVLVIGHFAALSLVIVASLVISHWSFRFAVIGRLFESYAVKQCTIKPLPK
jgi:two-component system sensor histidine kinase VicK